MWDRGRGTLIWRTCLVDRKNSREFAVEKLLAVGEFYHFGITGTTEGETERIGLPGVHNKVRSSVRREAVGPGRYSNQVCV